MRIQVRTYSGYKADERPLSIDLGEATVAVQEVLDRWYGPDHTYFKVLGDNDTTYVIRHDLERDAWEMVVMENPSAGPEAR